MKRFFFYFVLGTLLVWYVAAMRRPAPAWHGPPPHARWAGRYVSDHAHGPAAREWAEARDHAARALAAARDEVRDAWHEARAELRLGHHKKHHAPRPPAPPLPPPPPPSAPAPREYVAGVPVPIVPGTAVTQALAEPPQIQTQAPTQTAPPAASTGPATAHWVEGRISATEERAVADAERALRDKVHEWLMPEVSHGWGLPIDLVQPMCLETETRTVAKDYGTLWIAKIQADFSPERRAEFLKAHHRDLVRDRLALLGGVLAMALVGLGAVAGYIHADEATRGYCTNWLRGLAVAGVGAAGVAFYHFLR